MSVVLFQVRGWTALIVAASGGHVEVCRLLLENRCEKDITDDYGRTALMRAAVEGRLEVCRLLLENRCEKDITDTDGSTALHLAAEFGRLQVTRYLVEQGGISPLVKTHQLTDGSNIKICLYFRVRLHTIAAAKNVRQYKEVMEYLEVHMVLNYKCLHLE
ncbi:ANKRD6 [Mytilus coruscus]|uniref:ANKRD6 n=1 Tax=Mytilus coruscus TaxID=42192 RepID=A0A6J8CZ04_MYTCO|nr:ANKRD6 [Mytilus coruscus]